MTSQINSGQAQVQRVANDITAHLTQLVKDPPDLSTYLRAHADCISQAIRPSGLSYEMLSANNLQRVLSSNLESLEYRNRPEQELSFQKAARLAVNKSRSVMIEANTMPAEGLHGLKPEDSPAPDELPLFNQTPFQHFFVPILVGTASVGVLHIWFTPTDANGTQIRQVLLHHACGEIELYLKSRRLSDISQELTRLSTYSHLLQELAGDVDLESVAWNIVNYARESLACERVCLFVATDYGRAARSKDAVRIDYHYELHACSGLKKPHPRSEHAVILEGVARKLTEMALARTSPVPPPVDSISADAVKNAAPNGHQLSPPATSTGSEARLSQTRVSSAPNAAPTENDPKAEAGPSNKPAAPTAPRPQIQLTLIQRDPSKTAARPDEVNEYFEVLPMNWATVLPLFDRQNGVCGIVLFEGTKPPEKLETSFLHMRDLAVSAGHALGTCLHWNKQLPLRLAQHWIRFRRKLVDTTAKRWLINVALPTIALIGVLLFPITYRVKGQASVVPAIQHTLPVLTSSTLLNVAVREGELVAKDQILATFDATELQLQLRQALEEYQRALVDSDAARSAGNEPQMQMSRLSAAKASAQAEKIQNDIKNSTIRAPFDGMVLGAQSLSNRIGQFLRQGEPVLQIVDPHHWQVKIDLREQDIAYIESNLRGQDSVRAELKLAADPSKAYPLKLTNKAQLAYGLDISNGKYFFGALLPLELSEAQGSLFKSGFSGRASFDLARRPLGYVLFRDFANFIRLTFF